MVLTNTPVEKADEEDDGNALMQSRLQQVSNSDIVFGGLQTSIDKAERQGDRKLLPQRFQNDPNLANLPAAQL